MYCLFSAALAVSEAFTSFAYEVRNEGYTACFAHRVIHVLRIRNLLAGFGTWKKNIQHSDGILLATLNMDWKRYST